MERKLTIFWAVIFISTVFWIISLNDGYKIANSIIALWVSSTLMNYFFRYRSCQDDDYSASDWYRLKENMMYTSLTLLTALLMIYFLALMVGVAMLSIEIYFILGMFIFSLGIIATVYNAVEFSILLEGSRK